MDSGRGHMVEPSKECLEVKVSIPSQARPQPLPLEEAMSRGQIGNGWTGLLTQPDRRRE
jgi:hypothetical protein